MKLAENLKFFLRPLSFASLCVFISGCSGSAPRPLSLTPEDDAIVTYAGESLQNLKRDHGIESAKYEEDFKTAVLQTIELYRAVHPNTPLGVSVDSNFGNILRQYSPKKWSAKCIRGDVIDLDCLHRKLMR